MPNFDETGPKGKGPLTGRGMGFCVVKLDKNNLSIKQNIKKEVDNMPRGDRTGPAGLGSMTGRSAGYCAGYSVPGYANPIAGRGRGFALPAGRQGFGRGLGRGRGFGGGFGWQGAGYPYAYGNSYNAVPYAPEMTPQQETDMLKGQAKGMQDEINAINERIKELESSSKS
ncbi:MAG: DUF5320 domain-containing protein [Candidatus Omnitrophica bacterium]|nr:DUF5320 domain-containing protein [Candidatus Omnitrophota bacterium]